jgi:hypothetical protein
MSLTFNQHIFKEKLSIFFLLCALFTLGCSQETNLPLNSVDDVASDAGNIDDTAVSPDAADTEEGEDTELPPGDLTPADLNRDMVPDMEPIVDLLSRDQYEDLAEDAGFLDRELSSDLWADVSTPDLDDGPELPPTVTEEEVHDFIPPPLPFCEEGPMLMINEVATSNWDVLSDEEWDSPDWIEIYNPSDETVSLGGWALSDNEDNPYKWIFRDAIIEPLGYYLVYASNKGESAVLIDIPEGVSVESYNTLINWGDAWRYLDVLSPPPTDWNTPLFDDSSWSGGSSGFGREDGDDSTVLTSNTVYIRKRFTITEEELLDLSLVRLDVDYDDAFVAYINGVEVARANIGIEGVPPAYTDFAITTHEAVLYTGGSPEDFSFVPPDDLLLVGDNLLAIEVHDAAADSSDLSLIPFLSLGFNSFWPDYTLAPTLLGDITPPDGSTAPQHANFSLATEGETLVLHSPERCLVDRVEVSGLRADESYGTSSEGERGHYFMNPTPERANTTLSFPGFAQMPVMTPEGGIYEPGEAGDSVTITVDSPDAYIIYTQNMSDPTEGESTSDLYESPLLLSENTTVYRARAYEEGLWPSRIATNSYIQRGDYTIPVMSVVMEREHWSGVGTGIYLPYDQRWWKHEVPVHVEYWEPDGSFAFEFDSGMKTNGSGSLGYDMISFRLLLRGGYGTNAIEYPLFGEDFPVQSFKRVILRSAGHDWDQGHLRDVLIHLNSAQMGIETLAFQPAAVWINGEYWGLVNLRERPDEHYLASHFEDQGVTPDNVDLLEFGGGALAGDSDEYYALTGYMASVNMNVPENYEYVQTLMDVDEMSDYVVGQSYFANDDWPWNNIKYWQPRGPDGRWRWIMYDTDFGLGLWGRSADMNVLSYAINNEYIDDIFRPLLTNREYKVRFTNRYADYMNTIFLPENAQEIVNETARRIEYEVPYQQIRWGFTTGTWYTTINFINGWLEDRPYYARNQLNSEMGFNGQFSLALNTAPENAGRFQLTAVEVTPPFLGLYFDGAPVSVTIIPSPGWIFDSWSDTELSEETSVSVSGVSGSYVSLTANLNPVFPGAEQLVINEISYHPNNHFASGDWIELYNPGDASIDLSFWSIQLDGIDLMMTLPEDTLIEARGYLVLAGDLLAFQSHFPDVGPVVSELAFDLPESGGALHLMTPDGLLHDLALFDDNPPWPPSADGVGQTLELLAPVLDNALSESWLGSLARWGTPGGENRTILP